MPSGRLILYRFIEDAWSGGLRAWCDQPGETWLLLENPGQTRWLSRNLARAAISGVRIFDAATFRDELAKLAGLDPLPRHGATAEFAVKVAAGQSDAARNAPALAEACDALSRAGRHLNQLPVDTPIARRLHRILDRSAILPGFLDRRLQNPETALPPINARICCIGWDATHWPNLALLDLAASNAASFEMYVPSPRLPADARQREWIEALEQRLGLERLTCPESGFTSENEPLVARLENSELATRAEARPPGLLVGREWPDQVRLVVNQVADWLAEYPTPDSPIGIVAPDDSPTAVAVAEALEKTGIPVEHPSRLREPDPASLILEQVARYHLNDHDVSDLLELTRLLWLHARETWPALAPDTVQDALDRAFKAAQTRNSRILARALPKRQDDTWTAVCALVEALGRWDEALSKIALLGHWYALLAGLSLPPDPLGGAWTRLFVGLYRDELIPGRAFMEWLAAHLSAQRRALPPPITPPSPPS